MLFKHILQKLHAIFPPFVIFISHPRIRVLCNKYEFLSAQKRLHAIFPVWRTLWIIAFNKRDLIRNRRSNAHLHSNYLTFLIFRVFQPWSFFRGYVPFPLRSVMFANRKLNSIRKNYPFYTTINPWCWVLYRCDLLPCRNLFFAK